MSLNRRPVIVTNSAGSLGFVGAFSQSEKEPDISSSKDFFSLAESVIELVEFIFTLRMNAIER